MRAGGRVGGEQDRGAVGGLTCVNWHFLGEVWRRGLQEPRQDGLRLRRGAGRWRSDERDNEFVGESDIVGVAAAAAAAAADGGCHFASSRTSTEIPSKFVKKRQMSTLWQ